MKSERKVLEQGMKRRSGKYILVMILVFAVNICVVSAGAKAEKKILTEDEELPRTAVKFSAGIVLGVINPAVEIHLFNRVNLQMDVLGCFQAKGFLNTDDPLTLGMSFLEGRYYFREAYRGFFVGPSAGFGVWRLSKCVFPLYKHDYNEQYQVGSNIMLGMTLGYNFPINRHWSIDGAVSGGWSGTRYEGHNRSDGSLYVSWNGSGEWLPVYKGALSIVYRW